MNRRRYLTALGAIATLAGCTSSGSSGNSQAIVGDSQASDGIEVTPESVEAAVSYEIGHHGVGFDRLMTREGTVVVLINLEVTIGDGSGAIINATDRLSLTADRSKYWPENVDAGEIEYPVSGEFFDNMLIESGSSRRGWQLFLVDREDIENLRMEWEPSDNDPLSWNLGLSSSDLPDLSLSELRIPNEVEMFEPAEVTATVANSGGSAGRYVDPVFDDHPDEGPWIDVIVDPGEVAEPSVEIDPQNQFVDGQVRVEVGGTRDTVEWVTPTREVGEPYTLPGGLEVSVEDWQTAQRVVRESSGADPIEYTAESGEQLVLLKLRSYNGDDRTRTAMIEVLEFRDESGPIATETVYPSAYGTPTKFTDPDLPVYHYDDLSPSEEITGWALYRVDSTADLSGKYAHWERGLAADSGEPPGIEAQWRL